MKKLTFEDLWQHFEQDFPDLSLAQGKVFSYIKLFQHASSYYALSDERKLIAKPIDEPEPLLRLKFALKNIIYNPKRVPLKPVVMLDDKRTIDTPEGQKSYYFDCILKEIGHRRVSVMNDTNKQTALPAHIDRKTLWSFGNFALDATDLRVLRDIQHVLRKAKKALNERPQLYRYLAAVFTVFFADFHRYHHLLKDQSVTHLLLTTHYHHEGLIAAAKLNAIAVVEFQHGLIAKEDLYYVYPASVEPFVKNALFADNLCVFGSYWKSVLAIGKEYPEGFVHVVGDYSLRSQGLERFRGVEKRNVLLVTAQKNSVSEYVSYVQGLISLFKRKHPDWEIWVKLHPLEKQAEAYQVLTQYERCKIFGKESNLMELLAACKIQVSIYSTTLYDALGLNVINLSVQNYGRSADYAQAMVHERVAVGISTDDDPVEVAERAKDSDLLNEAAVYAPFDSAVFNALLKETRVR